MPVPDVAPVAWLRVRLEEKLARRGLIYPWWIPVFSMVGQYVIVLLALIQRDALVPPQPVALCLVVLAAAPVVELTMPARLSWWVYSASVLGVTAWLVAVPLGVTGPSDSAPALLMLLAAIALARDGEVRGLIVGAISMALLVLFGVYGELGGVPFYLLEVVLGLVVGYLIRWQMRALVAERAARASERSRATVAERQRIARDIHDLVAHSLSVTLLQLQGARRALAEGEVAEAGDALADAERVGRQAMADIRRTVGAMNEEAGTTRLLPGAADIPVLVEEFRVAGLRVSYSGSGDPSALPDGTGVGLYRIAQEALANVAKHAPGADATVALDVRRDRARLAVCNALPAGRARVVAGGAGLPGMAARAEGLGATLDTGPDGDHWRVDVRVPLEGLCAGLAGRGHARG